MYLLKALCAGVTDPKNCPDLWGVFSYMPDRTSGECGIQNGTWCLDGKNTIASSGNTYYALCADAIGETQHFQYFEEKERGSVKYPHSEESLC